MTGVGGGGFSVTGVGGGGGFWRQIGGGRGKIYGLGALAKKSEFGAGVPEKINK